VEWGINKGALLEICLRFVFINDIVLCTVGFLLRLTWLRDKIGIGTHHNRLYRSQEPPYFPTLAKRPVELFWVFAAYTIDIFFLLIDRQLPDKR